MSLPSQPGGTTKPGGGKDCVLAELDRVLAGQAFARVERPGRFLRHLVELALAGETHLLKESVLGMDVFGRAPAWDPRLDPIVRQEAARLRKRLSKHYEAEESASITGVRIELPVGSYVPVFKPVEQSVAALPEDIGTRTSPSGLAEAVLASGQADARPTLGEADASPSAPQVNARTRWPKWKTAVGPAILAGLAVLVTVVSLLSVRHYRASKSPTEDIYLRGIYYWQKRTPESLQRAVEIFQQAIKQDPNYAKAYVGLANCYNLLREFAAMPEREAYPQALAATRKALELDDSLAEAHASLAFISFWWNWNAALAEKEYRRAIELDPNYATAHHWYATFLSTRLRYQEALAEIRAAQKLEPGSTAILADKGLLLYSAGETDQAIALLKQMESDADTLPSVHRYLARIYLDQGDYKDYVAEEKRLAIRRPTPMIKAVAAAAAQGLESGGSKGMLESVLAAQLELHRKGLAPSYYIAETYGQLGRSQEALSYLNAASQEPGSLFLSYRGDSAFQSLRLQPGYRDLDAKFEPFISAGTLPERK